MRLRVVKVQDKKGLTKPIDLVMLPSSVRRLIRAERARVDMSFTTESKDKVLLRIKPLLVTRDKINRSTITDLQNAAKKYLADYCAKNDYEAVFSEVARTQIQKDMRNVLEKVTPMKLVEIRAIEVELVKGQRELGDCICKSTFKTKEGSSERS